MYFCSIETIQYLKRKMNWQQLKERYARFKRWQHEPTKFLITSDEEHVCQCCGYRYKGNFCPCCAQKAGLGRISWKSVHQGVMDIWGLGTRSLLRSVWNLLTRPGYFISEYISGKRQVSFPPVKMLFIVAVIYSFVAYWLLPEVFHVSISEDEKVAKLLTQYMDWQKTHFSWELMMMAILAIIPTWLMFRYSPRHTRHTIPEGFFIQVFYSVLTTVLSFFLLPLKVMDYSTVLNVIVALVTMYYYIVGYMQLFGYGLWGTLWRQGFIYFCIVGVTWGMILAFFGFNQHIFGDNVDFSEDQIRASRYLIAAGGFIFGLGSLAVGYMINLIATRKVRKEMLLNEISSRKEKMMAMTPPPLPKQ